MQFPLYHIKSQQQNLIYKGEKNDQIKQLIPLESNLVFGYTVVGHYFIYDINEQKITFQGELGENIHHITCVNKNQLALIEIDEIPKLRVFSIFDDDFVEKFDMELPTVSALTKKEKKNISPQELLNRIQFQTSITTLNQTGFIVICEEKVNAQSEYEYVLTVLKEDHLPQTYAQFVYKSGKIPLRIQSINKKDTIALYPQTVNDQNLKFLVWNLSLKEKGCQVLEFKEKINTTVVSITNWGNNKVAFWSNPTHGGRPEVRVMDIKSQGEFHGIIDCFDEEEWLLSDLLLIDTDRNFALIQKIGQRVSSLEIVYLGKFRCTFSQAYTVQTPLDKLQFSIDNQFYVRWQNCNVHASVQQQSIVNQQIGGDEISFKIEVGSIIKIADQAEYDQIQQEKMETENINNNNIQQENEEKQQEENQNEQESEDEDEENNKSSQQKMEKLSSGSKKISHTSQNSQSGGKNSKKRSNQKQQ